MTYMLYAGALLDRAPGEKYSKQLRFAEISLRAPMPKPSTLLQWRSNLPESFVLSLVAPKSALVSSKGALRFDASLEQMVKWLDESARAMRARFIVLPTTSELTTGQRDRDLLASYVDRLRADGRQIVWAPSGLWEPEAAQALCQKLDLVYGFDPLETVAPHAKTLYARVMTMGFRKRIGEEALELLLSNFENSGAAEAFVAFETQTSHRDATRLVNLAKSMAEEGEDEDEDEDDFEPEDGDDEERDEDDVDGEDEDEDDDDGDDDDSN